MNPSLLNSILVFYLVSLAFTLTPIVCLQTFGRHFNDSKCQPVTKSPNHKNNPWRQWHPLSCCCPAVSCMERASSVTELPCQGFFIWETEISTWPLPKLTGFEIKGGKTLLFRIKLSSKKANFMFSFPFQCLKLT